MKRYILIVILILSSLLRSNQFINGVDISMLKQVEDNGGVFYENGIQIDPIQIFKDKGINTARIKIWHTPSLNYNNLESVLEIAYRANSVGLDLGAKWNWNTVRNSLLIDLNFYASMKFGIYIFLLPTPMLDAVTI